jgi:hypothetical protein
MESIIYEDGYNLINQIAWDILISPSESSVRYNDFKKHKKFTENDLDKMLFRKSVTICFLLHNNCEHTVERETGSEMTIRQVLQFIYDFYKEEITEDNYLLGFEGEDELREDAEMICDAEGRKMINSDVFSTEPDPIFEGFEYKTNESGDVVFETILGPT